MQRVGHVWRAKPGKIDEYRRVHATVWPELEQLFRDNGVTSYTIYVWGDVLFSHMEVEDYDALMPKFAASEVAQRWEVELMADLIEYPDGDPETGWPLVLDEVWNLEEAS